MRKLIFQLVFLSMAILYFSEIKAQTQPNLQTTFDWITAKMKLYAKRVGIAYQTENVNNFFTTRNSENEVVLSFEIEPGDYYKTTYWIYPMRVTTFSVSDVSITLGGTNVLRRYKDWYRENASDDIDRYDEVVIAMDMNQEENFVSRMKKALETFVSLKKKKAAPGEAF